MNLNTQNLYKNKNGCCGCFTEWFFVIFYFVCLFIWFPFSPFIGLGVYFLRKYLRQKTLEKEERAHKEALNKAKTVMVKVKKKAQKIIEKEKTFDELFKLLKEKVKKTNKQDFIQLEENLESSYKKIIEKEKTVGLLKKKLKKNNKPDFVQKYRGFSMEMFQLENKKIAIRLNIDNRIVKTYSSYRGLVINRRNILSFIPLSSDIYSLLGKCIWHINRRARNLKRYIKEYKLDCFFLDTRSAKDFINRKFESLIKIQAQKELNLQKREKIKYLAKAYQKRQSTSQFKRNLLKIDDLLKLTPIEFEKWTKKHIFEKEGWEVSETKKTGDGGIDLVLWKNEEKSIAQCKRFRETVGEPMLRDFYGTMMSEGVSRGFFVTTGLFSLSALKFTEDKPIEMIDRRVLAQKLSENLSKTE